MTSMYFIVIPIIILIGVVIIILIATNEKKVKTKDDFDFFQKEIDVTKNEVDNICSIVDSKYNRSTSKIILDPNKYKNLYEDISDLIEKTEVMVIEYLQQVRKQSNLYDYSWIYEGLNENKECVYKIIKKKIKPFVGNDSDYTNNIENLGIVVEYFMSNHKEGGYQFEDIFSGQWVQLAEIKDNYYVAELCLLDNKGNFIDDENTMSNARNNFKEYEVLNENIFRKNITNNPNEGVLFILDSFFKIFQLNRVRFSFKTNMKEEFKNSQFNLDDLTFVFDRWQYFNGLRDKLITTETTSDIISTPELSKKKRSRRITQEVKDKVWNRDGGKCVECGSNENLEFDHIIPHSKGGANTYRNIQLLCEPCNRSKSAKIG